MSAKILKTKEKKWILKTDESREARNKKDEIAKALGINPIVAELLYNRGYTDERLAKSFLYMESEMLCNPFDMKDMEKGIRRIKAAIDQSRHRDARCDRIAPAKSGS